MSGTNEPGSPGDDELPDQDEFELPEDLDEDEAPDEVPEEDLAPPDDQPPPRQSRRERQEANWRERAIRAEAERDAYREVRQQAPQPQRIDPQLAAQQRAQEYQRISMLPPEEQVAAIDRMIEQRTALGTLQAFDRADRSDFERMKAQYPAARRLAPQVEQTINAQRAQGVYQFSREQVYHYLLGQEVHSRSVEGATRQRQTGQRNVQRQTVQPRRGARGDVATSGNRARGADADRRLLESIRIDDL